MAQQPKKSKARRRLLPALCAIALGLALIGLGFWRGEPWIVERKAVRICTECIGIG